MAYEPTVWKNGDVITSEKLNNIEDGIVNSNTKVFTLDPNALHRYSIQLEPNLPLSFFINTYVTSDASDNNQGWFCILPKGHHDVSRDEYWFTLEVSPEWSHLVYHI